MGLQKLYITSSKKSFVYMKIKSYDIPEVTEKLEELGLDFNYDKRDFLYNIKFKKASEFTNNVDSLLMLVDNAKEIYSVE